MATTAQEIFDAMPGRFLPEQAGDLNATILFDLSGEGGGQWLLTVANKQASVTREAIPNPTLTFGADASDFAGIIGGQVNAMQAFMQGKVKVKGDMTLAIRLMSLFKRD
jgi:putative sterol carrier protein